MHTIWTFFKKEIFAEGLLPDKPTNKVFIFCDGAPSAPSKYRLMEFFAKKGYAAFHIRYRGTWESKGVFLKKSLDQDLLDVIDELPKGVRDLWTQKRFKIAPRHIILMGTSFGGPAVIIASRDPRVTKAIAISPVIDWRAPSKDEPMPRYIKFMSEAYANVYRTTTANWNKLMSGTFYNPIAYTTTIDGSKICIIHAKDDHVVRIKEVRQFAKKTRSKFIELARGGHLSSSIIMKPALWKKIGKFVRLKA